MRRGRPKHNDILTPREWQVLELLRQGLTNEEIAERLSISVNGAKYHVSEILTKLGVGNRREAAAWQPEGASARAFGLAGLLSPLRRLSLTTAGKLAGGAVFAGAATGLALLAVGLFANHQRRPEAAGPLGRLAYVENGNLWTLDLPDGQPRQLTDAADLENDRRSLLSWSPSGEWLLIDSTVIELDSGDERTAEGCLAWSPARDELVCVRGTELVVESADGSRGHSVDQRPDDAKVWLDTPIWSSDGLRLVYSANGRDLDPQNPLDRSSLWVANRDGSDAREVFATPGSDLYGARLIADGWSADGMRIRFWADPSFSASMLSDGVPYYQIDAAGGRPERLTEGSVMLQKDFRDRELDENLLMTSGAGRETWTGKQIAWLDLAGGSIALLTDSEDSSFSPALSPDGLQIAYVSAPDIGHVGGGEDARLGMLQRRIWIMDADGGNKRRLTHDESYREERPLWSPDGTRIIFTRMDDEDVMSLWLADVPTGSTRRLAYLSPALSGGEEPPGWFGYYGYVARDRFFAWWQPAP